MRFVLPIIFVGFVCLTGFSLYGSYTYSDALPLGCELPVLDYSAGPENDEYLHAPTVEWVVEDFVPLPDSFGNQAGWGVLVRLVAEGDPEVDDEFVVIEEDGVNIAQVYFKGRWQRQTDFEAQLCNLPPSL